MRITGERFSIPSKSVRIQAIHVTFKFVSSARRSVSDLETDLNEVVEKPWTLVKDGLSVTFRRLTSNGTRIGRKNNLNTSTIQDLSFVSQNDSRGVFGKTCLRRNCLSSVEFIDMSDYLSCPFVEIPSNHFGGRLFLENQTLTFGNQTVVLRAGTYQESGVGVQLCVSEMTRITPSVSVFPNTSASWRATFSTVCLTVSDICLFLTFLVYCYLPSLQTLPGKNTMSLVFHLFVAQFLYLCGVNAVSNAVLCQTIGVVIHYMWLSSFFWMFVCAYHMYTVFSNLYGNSQSVSRERSDKRTFIHYCLFADLSPLILVAACISYVLGRSGGHQIGYGGDICFINSMEAIGIFFASPLLLILIFNLFFFIRTVLSLQRRPDLIAHSNVCNRNYVGIYFRLSLLLGFGWIFGFFPSNTVIFCLFSVFTGGQGIFIFVSFCINRRVLLLLSQKLNCSDLFFQSNSSTKSTDTQ
ncbi:putative adhesion G protein-coupled receptor E4P [Liolophura sinensis]|uniref:putative adhesion G protein-coupled receptor E4P n=1 Tax=Liolophura sinensis TaxID=3198878 RepID=UPI0031581F3E